MSIVETIWAEAERVVLDPAPAVPDDGLPVGAQLGDVDRASAMRLRGDERLLRLRPTDDGQLLGEAAAILACTVTDATWSQGGEQSLDDFPAYDADDCIAGIPNDQGVFVFDLSRLAVDLENAGVALVPDVATAPSFQVVFEAEALGRGA